MNASERNSAETGGLTENIEKKIGFGNPQGMVYLNVPMHGILPSSRSLNPVTPLIGTEGAGNANPSPLRYAFYFSKTVFKLNTIT